MTARLARLLRPACLAGAVLFALLPAPGWARQDITAARVWPAAEYTRVALERAEPFHYRLMMVKDPERLVLDLDGVEPSAALTGLTDKIRPDDPFVRQVRVGRFKPGTLRVVFDLKTAVRPAAFALEPAGGYGHRLVLDIYPAVEADPLLALIERGEIKRDAGDLTAAAPPPTVPDNTAPAADARTASVQADRSPAQGGRREPASDQVAHADPQRVETPPVDLVRSESLRREAREWPARNDGVRSDAVRGDAARNAEAGRGEGVARAEEVRPEPARADKSRAEPVPADPTRTDNPTAGSGAQSAAQEGSSAKAAAADERPVVDRLITVAIDAGHGGEDPGARGRDVVEKDVTLAIARRLKDKIDAVPNMRAVLVRDGDYFIPLAGRTAKARRLRADLFVSVHADSFVSPDAHGSSVFALSERGATSAAARWLAKRENESDSIGGVNLADKDPYLARTLFDLSQTATINDSLKLGRFVLDELGGLNKLHRGSVEQAGFAVLKSPDIPSILVETAFISNPAEERRLADGAYQERMANAIVTGIKRYFLKNPPAGRARGSKGT